MKKKIWIYFSSDWSYSYPLNQNRYLEPYFEISQKIEKKNIEVYIVRWNSYKWNWIFINSERFDSNMKLFNTGEVKIDLILNRDSENTIPKINDCMIINNQDFDDFCRDKFKTFNKFPEISPLTIEINSFKEYEKLITHNNFSNDDIVTLKKNYLEWGNWIYIWKVSWLTEWYFNDWSWILFQEFLDSSIWIDGIVEWLHDIRVTVVNNKIIALNIRQPKKWWYLANFAQWGTWFSVDVNKIPKDLLKIVNEVIIPEFKEYFPSLYSIDFMNSKKWFKLIEFNSRPWVQHRSKVEKYYIFNDALIELLIESVNIKNYD